MTTSGISLYSRACPLCGSDDKTNVFAQPNFDPTSWDRYSFSSRKLPENAHLGLILCPVCALLYADPVPSLETITKSYVESAFDGGRESYFASLTYAELLTSHQHLLPDKQAALDVGTGDGCFLERLMELGFNSVTGIEPSRAPIESAKPATRAHIKEGMFRASDFPANSLSLITCFQTFEHLYDPKLVLEQFHSLLKPGGVVFIVFHNRLSMSAKAMGLKSPIYDVEHLQLFSHESASYLFEKCGFKNIQMKTVINRYPLAYWARLFPFPKSQKPQILETLNKNAFGNWLIPLPAGNFAGFAVK